MLDYGKGKELEVMDREKSCEFERFEIGVNEVMLLEEKAQQIY